MANRKKEILEELQRITEDATYSSKGHYNAAERWRVWNYVLGVPAAVASAAAGVSALSSFSGHELIAACLSIATAVLAALMTFLNPSDQAAKHRAAANQYHSLKNKCRITTSVDQDLGDVALRKELAKLSELRDELNTSAPAIPGYAFKKARRGIEGGESVYAVDRRATK